MRNHELPMGAADFAREVRLHGARMFGHFERHTQFALGFSAYREYMIDTEDHCWAVAVFLGPFTFKFMVPSRLTLGAGDDEVS